MVATLYSDLLRDARNTKYKYGDEQLRDWFRDKALETSKTPTNFIKEAGERSEARAGPGRMLFYNYDPKHKATLPYYDRFPLIFKLSEDATHFLGINLHYLPPIYRARLLDMLYDTLNNKKFDSTTKLKINYQILNAASKFSYFRPCIKKYLKSHVRSRMVEIHPKEWDYVAFLPLARFEKSRQRDVWTESVDMIMKGRR